MLFWKQLFETVTNTAKPFSQGKNNALHYLSDYVTRTPLIRVKNNKTYHNNENQFIINIFANAVCPNFDQNLETLTDTDRNVD